MKRFAYLCLLCLALSLTGCALLKQTPQTVLVPTPIPCAAAQEQPDAPARTLTLDAGKPGDAAAAYAANRTRWIGFADALKTKLDACK